MLTTSLNWFGSGFGSLPVCSVRSLPTGVEATKSVSSRFESATSRCSNDVVLDPERHAEAGDLRRRDRAAVRARVAAVVDLQRVGAGAAVEVEVRVVDLVERAVRQRIAVDHRRPCAQHLVGDAGVAADADDVLAGAGVDERRPGDRLDVERVGAVAAVDVGRRVVRGCRPRPGRAWRACSRS